MLFLYRNLSNSNVDFLILIFLYKKNNNKKQSILIYLLTHDLI